MGILLDPPTLFVALLVSMVGAAVVLFWAFWINREEKSLLWLAVGFVISSVANVLIAGRGSLPDFIPTYIGGSVIVLAVSMAWVAARVFNGRRVEPWVLVVGPVAWIIGCNIPIGLDTYEGRVVLVSCLTAVYYFAAAREFLVPRDGLRTRLPLALAIAAHGGLVLLRAFLILVQDDAGNIAGVPWFGVGMLETLVFIQVIAFLMVSLTKERVEKRLEDAAHTDPLTGLGNRRAFFVRAEAAVAQAQRNGAPLSVIVFDLDRFKAINDQHGHPVGDAVIKAFAGVALGRLRTSDFIARFGGEEFAALLPDTDGAHAAFVAMQINQTFEAGVASLPHDGLTGTASAGVAELAPATPSLEDILAAADRALYGAKANGRGQVKLADRSERLEPRTPQVAA